MTRRQLLASATAAGAVLSADSYSNNLWAAPPEPAALEPLNRFPRMVQERFEIRRLTLPTIQVKDWRTRHPF